MDPFAASSPTRPPRIGLTDVSNQGPAAETPHAKLRILSALPSMSSSTASDTSTATSTTTGAAAAAATTSTPRSQLLRDVSRSSSSIDPNASRSFEAGDASVAWPSASFLPDTSSASFSIHHHHHNQSNQSLQSHQSQQENRRETVAFFKAAAEKEKPHVPQFALLQQKEHPPKGNVQPLIERFNSMLPSPSSAQADTRDASQQPNISDDDVVHVLMGIGLPGRSKNTSSIKETPNTSISVENLLDQAPPSDEFNSSTFLATPAPLKHNTHQEHIIPAKKENDEAATSKNIPALSSSTTAAPMFTFPAPSSSSTLSFQSAIPVPTSSSGFNFTSAVSFGSNSADKKPAAFSFDSKATTAPFSKPFSFAAASKPLLFTQVPEKKEAINEPSNTFTFRPTATEKFAVNVTEEATKLKSDPPTSFFPPSRIEANESNDGPKPSFSFGLSSATSSTEKTKADVLELSKDSITDEKISTEAVSVSNDIKKSVVTYTTSVVLDDTSSRSNESQVATQESLIPPTSSLSEMSPAKLEEPISKEAEKAAYSFLTPFSSTAFAEGGKTDAISTETSKEPKFVPPASSQDLKQVEKPIFSFNLSFPATVTASEVVKPVVDSQESGAEAKEVKTKEAEITVSSFAAPSSTTTLESTTPVFFTSTPANEVKLTTSDIVNEMPASFNFEGSSKSAFSTHTDVKAPSSNTSKSIFSFKPAQKEATDVEVSSETVATMLSTNESKPLFSFMAPQKDTPVVQTVAQLTENTVTGTDVKVVDVLTKEKGEEKAECPISDPVESKTLPEGLNDRTDKAATEAVSTPRPAFALPKKKQESWKKLMVPESPYVGGGVVSGGIVLPQLSLKQTGVSKVVPATIETKVEEAAVVSKIPVPRSSKKLGGVSSLSQVCQKEEDEGVVEVEEIVKAEKVADEELNAAVNAETLPLNENHQNVYEDEDPVVDLDDAVIHDISMMDESELDGNHDNIEVDVNVLNEIITTPESLDTKLAATQDAPPTVDLSFSSSFPTVGDVAAAAESVVGENDDDAMNPGLFGGESFDVSVIGTRVVCDEEEEDISVVVDQVVLTTAPVAPQTVGVETALEETVVVLATGTGSKSKQSVQQQQEKHGNGNRSGVPRRSEFGKENSGSGKIGGRDDDEDEDDRKRDGRSVESGHRVAGVSPSKAKKSGEQMVERASRVVATQQHRALATVLRMERGVKSGELLSIKACPEETLEDVQDRLLFEFRLAISKALESIEKDKMDEVSFQTRLEANKSEATKLEQTVRDLEVKRQATKDETTKLAREVSELKGAKDVLEKKIKELNETLKMNGSKIIKATPLTTYEYTRKYLLYVIRWAFVSMAAAFMGYCFCRWVYSMYWSGNTGRRELHPEVNGVQFNVERFVWCIFDAIWELLVGPPVKSSSPYFF